MGQKVGGLEAGPAHQRSIDVGNGENFRRVRGFTDPP